MWLRTPGTDGVVNLRGGERYDEDGGIQGVKARALGSKRIICSIEKRTHGDNKIPR